MHFINPDTVLDVVANGLDTLQIHLPRGKPSTGDQNVQKLEDLLNKEGVPRQDVETIIGDLKQLL